ncbi:helicase-related protein, partial [Shigella sp. SHS-8]|uniref:helicase-related protein n=1 Tax=Shigella sp. SHS-8 TaxID=2116507 RepID=UPI00149362A8
LSTIVEGTTENIVVFYQFKQELVEIKKILKNKRIFEVNGQCFNLPKKQPQNSVTLVQYQAGSAGIELQYANIVIFYTPTYSFQDYSQSLGRAYRNGQTKKVTVYQFNTENTIEEKVWEALENKKDFSEKRYLDTTISKKGDLSW